MCPKINIKLFNTLPTCNLVLHMEIKIFKESEQVEMQIFMIDQTKYEGKKNANEKQMQILRLEPNASLDLGFDTMLPIISKA